MNDPGESISLRLAMPDDSAFLLKLFTSTRIDEFRFLDGDQNQLESLLGMQFNLQSQQYHNGYPDAEDSIILSAGEPVGRIFVDEGEREFTLIDIALLPEYRNTGIGGHLIKRLMHRATAAEKTVRLHVLKSNRARHLYERLGFREIDADDMYSEMTCAPQSVEGSIMKRTTL